MVSAVLLELYWVRLTFVILKLNRLEHLPSDDVTVIGLSGLCAQYYGNCRKHFKGEAQSAQVPFSEK